MSRSVALRDASIIHSTRLRVDDSVTAPVTRAIVRAREDGGVKIKIKIDIKRDKTCA